MSIGNLQTCLRVRLIPDQTPQSRSDILMQNILCTELYRRLTVRALTKLDSVTPVNIQICYRYHSSIIDTFIDDR